MTQENASARPLRLIEVLEAEFEFLHHPLPAAAQRNGAFDAGTLSAQDRGSCSDEECNDRRREIYLRRCIHDLPVHDKRSALCLSGGGVRSATFGLGVIQALAKQGWLQQFHYMSSVSGGGYIASWLSSWIERSGGDTAAVINRIAADPLPPARTAAPEPAQIKRLRAYSNYLSPVHGLSMDLVTLVATFVRNLALHWMVLLPLLAALIMLPRAHLAMLLHFMRNPNNWSFWILLTLSFSIGIFGFLNILRNLPGYSTTPPNKNSFIGHCYLPILIANVLLSWIVPALSQHRGMPYLPRAIFFPFCGAVLLFACKATAVLLQPSNPHSRDNRWAGMIPLTIAGALSGTLLLTIAQFVGGLAFRGGAVDAGFDFSGKYAIVGVPALLAALWICMTLHVGLSHPTHTREDEREWWARASAYIFWTIVAWLIVTSVVILGPWLVLECKWGKEAAGSAGLLGLATGAYGYWSKHGSAVQRKLKSAVSTLGDRVFEISAAVFIVTIVIAISFVLAVACGVDSSGQTHAEKYANLTRSAPIGSVAAIFICLLALMFASSYFVGANTFSLHNMYGNRLVRAYLGASNSRRDPNPFTGFDPNDNRNMRDLFNAMNARHRSDRKLFHVVNIALNLVKPSSSRLEWQQRKAAGYTISPLHAGAACTGFQPSGTYTGQDGISLARAMTISGAAATPNMGYHTSALVAFAMTFFNIRLGWWLPNPGNAGKKCWDRSEPKGGMASLVKESLASTTDENAYVYLSDGGHFENLGLYEMVRRRCHHIVLVDAGCDPKYQFEDLENAVRKIRIDLGISIVFPHGLPTPKWSRGDLNKHQHSSVATIRYSDIDGDDTDGVLIYIKPLLSGDEPLDITRYAALAKKNQRNPFPHHPTADQFFDEVRFESYRELGYHSVMRDKILGRDARAGGAWPAPERGAVDASEAEVAASEINSEVPVAAGDNSGALHMLSATGLMSLSSVAIPAVVALGLAAIVALGQAFPPAPAAPGSDGGAAGQHNVHVTVDLNADAFQAALTERFTQLLSATAQLERSVGAVNADSARTVAEMHALLRSEIELMKLARGKDSAAAPIVTLDVLLKFREALKKDPVVVSDPHLGLILNKLDDTKKMLESAEIGKRLVGIEEGVNRAHPRTNVSAGDGGRQ
ncbi:hypothetical protein F2P44_25335 [Massilia sp. CCM 8695]|uniref:PNPLA domain-containing protein n=1 Tax=Massilia frigida TaxID=2609281 RepID=A0ABX0NAW1_9BURK|nr:patatin-like phospholipase family protein [Massilia frigida]NHZ82576.1 hypothetical protein [Massilia frigida]